MALPPMRPRTIKNGTPRESAASAGAGAAPASQFEGARETIWEYLWRTAADFVTPADLSYSQSLYLLGRLDVNLALEASSDARPLDL